MKIFSALESLKNKPEITKNEKVPQQQEAPLFTKVDTKVEVERLNKMLRGAQMLGCCGRSPCADAKV